MIKINGVSKRIKKHHILSDVSLQLEGIYGLIGPNGAGKTTLMKILSSLISMNAGQVEMKGENYRKGKYVKQNTLIGYLPQDFMVYPNIGLEEALDHIAMLQGMMNKQERQVKVRQVIQQVNLQGHENKKMIELSGGMRKRVGIAQLLMGDPSILLFDEPTAGLDIEERIRFRNLLRNLGTERTVVISSHIVEDIEFLCTKIGVLKEGRVLFEGSPAELKARAKGQVWEYQVAPSDLDAIMNQKEVVQITEESNGMCLRVYSTKSESDAISVEPRLVDGYLAVVKGMNR
ncbi:ABC transporter ATP-binding protein [Planomicrobium chinense]|uniref:ABC transporter ATP-binding protein n=1 Tax=Planococcus chinensis TaxID=272917 RepID=UPI001CC35317|nr:ABC transporter ATP-binding protein [Planococcus chinensis]MBZ5201847.1 ABC transporter ATP-binding protein [Planococcus chinensis]